MCVISLFFYKFSVNAKEIIAQYTHNLYKVDCVLFKLIIFELTPVLLDFSHFEIFS